MRLLYVADGRSPIALSWIQHFIHQGHEVHLASTFPCQTPDGLASFDLIPVAFSSAKAGSAQTGKAGRRPQGFLWSASLVRARTTVRQWLGPLTLPAAARRLNSYAASVRPELVHAMRIPYEGMLASLADVKTPLLISVWGNDLTLHAVSNPWMGRLTRSALRQASALHTDCQRDQRLACSWGFSEAKPSVVLPGAGGVDTRLFYPPREIDPRPVVINPRGFRAYVRTDTFFRSIPQVLKVMPETRFVCPAMMGERKVQAWIEALGIAGSMEILPQLSRAGMADLFRRSWVTVSPSFHDGTPNTLLEAMACGSFPVAGDLESIREWITPGRNGLLVDPADPQALAEAVLIALQDCALREQAAVYNVRMISERAAYDQVMAQADEFYQKICGGRSAL